LKPRSIFWSGLNDRGAASVTVIFCEAVLLLPAQSVAVQVRVTEYWLGHGVGAVKSADVSVLAPSQASSAVGLENTGVAGQKMIRGPPTPEITGGVLSSTVIVCEAVLLLPQSSVAVQVRVLEYSLGHAVGVVESTNVGIITPSQASVAVGLEKDGKLGHWIVRLGPTPEITGAVLSSTVIVCEAVEKLPQSSVAVQVRVTEYSCGQIPLGVVTSLNVKVGVGSQASIAVGAVNDGVAGHSIVALAP
jgi:hypothetical protein